MVARLSGDIAARGDLGEMAALAVAQVAEVLAVHGAAAVQVEADGARRLLAGWGSLAPHRPTDRDGISTDGLVVPFGQGPPLSGYLLVAEKSRHGDIRATDRQLVATVAAVLGIAIEVAALRADLAKKLDSARAQQQEMQLWARRLVEAQEAERRRLARELHDGPLQSVLAMARGAVASVASVAVEGIREAALDVADELRSLASSLHPALLDDLGPADALQLYIARTVRVLGSRGPVVELEAGPLPVLSDPARLGLFRIAQEALNNALRHARAQRIEIRFMHRPALHQLVVTVHDDGQGFPWPTRPGSWVAAGHLGVASMYERAAMLGGTVTIATGQGTGTTVELVAPAPDAEPVRIGGKNRRDSRAVGG